MSQAVRHSSMNLEKEREIGFVFPSPLIIYSYRLYFIKKSQLEEILAMMKQPRVRTDT